MDRFGPWDAEQVLGISTVVNEKTLRSLLGPCMEIGHSIPHPETQLMEWRVFVDEIPDWWRAREVLATFRSLLSCSSTTTLARNPTRSRLPLFLKFIEELNSFRSLAHMVTQELCVLGLGYLKRKRGPAYAYHHPRFMPNLWPRRFLLVLLTRKTGIVYREGNELQGIEFTTNSMVLVQEVYGLGVAVFRTRLGCEIAVATFLLGALWSGITCYVGMWVSVYVNI
jgi:hypothetical protein